MTSSITVQTATFAMPAPVATTNTACAPMSASKTNQDEILPLAQRRIAVYVLENRGYGDINFGFKLMEHLHDHVKVAKDKLHLCISSNRKEQDLEIFNKDVSYKLTIVDSLNSLKAKIDSLQMQFLVVGPVTAEASSIQNWSIPKAFINEYGFPQTTLLKSCGLKNDELGIFIDKELRAWSQTQAAQDYAEQIASIKDIHPALKQVILGQHAAKEKPYEAFCKDSRLYYGYACEKAVKEAFIQSIVQKVYQLSKQNFNLYFVLPGRELFLEKETAKKFFQSLQKCGIFAMKCYSLPKGCEKLNLGLYLHQRNTPLNTHQVTIIIPSLIPQQHIRRLIQASDACVVQGDQSPSEVISAGKPFIYECHHHKKTFFEDLVNNLQQSNKELAYIYPRINKEDINIDTDSIAQFFHRCTTDLKQVWANAMNQICTMHNASSKLTGYLEERLKHDPLKGSKETNYAQLDPQVYEGDLKDFPYDSPKVMNLDQTCGLRINPKTNSSDAFPGYFFFTSYADGYIITRTTTKK